MTPDSAATRFTVKGTRNGSLVHITWSEGGLLTGDPPTVDLVRAQADIVSILHSDPVAARPYADLVRDTTPEPLGSATSAYALISHVLDSVRETTTSP